MFLSYVQRDPSTDHPLTFETTALVPASISAARIAQGQCPTASEITFVKLPLPSKRDIIQNLEEVEGTERDGEVRAKRWRSFRQIREGWEPRLKMNNNGLYRTREVTCLMCDPRTGSYTVTVLELG